MLELKGKQELARAAQSLASSFELVLHDATTFIPAHWETEAPTPIPEPEDKIWLPLSRRQKQQLGNEVNNILFATDSEMSSFDYMLRQFATEETEPVRSIFVRTPDGLRVLNELGELVTPTGTFLPNFIKPMLNPDDIAKKEVFGVITEWLDSEEEAHSLLTHLATALAPGWSAVKYILLMGDGRNGKGVLLNMLVGLFGQENVSGVTRQAMAEQKPTCVELNNKLLNVIFDGQMDYIKDSGLEKTLIAGEPGYIRMLYESSTTKVQTTGLFIEALNKEPKSRDKSSALQKRLVRFHFPNVYALDHGFYKKMTSEPMLGAFLALLIDHYVTEDEVATKLAPTKAAMSMQVDQMWANSPMYQYLAHLVGVDPTMRAKLLGFNTDALISAFMAWRIAEGYDAYSSADVLNMLKDAFDLGWKSARVNGKVTKVRTIKGLKPETQALLEQLEEGTDDEAEALAELVGD